ncbi:MAG TPA: M42 family metallopeptidase [Bryobacteraceae bacterium]|nr:M42 family metallopeptidase [Bryobacteraceae bacterium]
MQLSLVFLVVWAAVTASAQSLDRTANLLERLSNAAGPPGFEEPVRKIMVNELKPFSSKLSYDGMGSIIAEQGSSGPRVMVDAHMDELGGVTRRVTEHGFVTMQMLGGWLDQALVDQRWIILGSKGPVYAVTGIRDIHVVPAEERTRVYSRDSLLLDIGATSAEEAQQMGVEPGDPVVPDAPFRVMNGTQNYLGKAWDDRIGCALVVEAMRRLATAPHPNHLFYAITTQEEVGLRGAHTAVETIKPDLGIAIEAGITGDVFPGHPEETQSKLGAGPGFFAFNSSELPNRKLVEFVKKAAAAKQIPLQADLVNGYGDDSAEIQKGNGGVPTICLVVPVRYTHAHNGIVNRRDFDQAVELVVQLLQTLDEAGVTSIRDFAQ